MINGFSGHLCQKLWCSMLHIYLENNDEHMCNSISVCAEVLHCGACCLLIRVYVLRGPVGIIIASDEPKQGPKIQRAWQRCFNDSCHVFGALAEPIVGMLWLWSRAHVMRWSGKDFHHHQVMRRLAQTAQPQLFSYVSRTCLWHADGCSPLSRFNETHCLLLQYESSAPPHWAVTLRSR